MCQAQFGDCRSRRAAASGHTSLLHEMVTAVASCLFSLAHTLAPLCSSLTHTHTHKVQPIHLPGSGSNQLGKTDDVALKEIFSPPFYSLSKCVF